MKRDAVYYVMPLGEIWLVRAIGSSADAYPTFEDALAAAERLAARGAQIRVLSRSGLEEPRSDLRERPQLAPLARTTGTATAEAEAADPRLVSSG